ncbi:MAG: flagellar hook-basal body complex protein FliE [Lachnospiraceae bacterium]|nr:flagellar hook-basal body complex protein FliE [Lachnospiraceae bacterium]
MSHYIDRAAHETVSNPIDTLNVRTGKAVSRMVKDGGESEHDMFSAIFNSALSNVSSANKYLSDAENEEIKLAMGKANSTHDLAIALQKASTALQYTVTLKNSFMEAYRTIINMQI